MKQRNYMALYCLTGWLFMAAGLSGCGHMGSPGSAPSDPLSLAIDFYRGPLDHLDAVRTGSCPMHPSCSEYSLCAIDKHGAWLGWIMACDRMMRCGRDALERTHAVLVDGERRYRDPLWRNDWWWDAPQRLDPLGGVRDWR